MTNGEAKWSHRMYEAESKRLNEAGRFTEAIALQTRFFAEQLTLPRHLRWRPWPRWYYSDEWEDAKRRDPGVRAFCEALFPPPAPHPLKGEKE
jgi:hypothetical protein